MANLTDYDDDFSDLSKVKRGTVVADWYKDGVRFLVIVHYGFCVYLGVPIDHPLAGFSYDDIPLDCHGGLTFAGEGEGEYRPKHFYFYGWDYAHAGDFTDFGMNDPIFEWNGIDKKWTVGEVKEEAEDVAYDFRKLMKLAEMIKSNKGITE